MAYRHVLDYEVSEAILSISRLQREELVVIFRLLANDPFLQGDSSFRDTLGRQIQKRRFGRWCVSYWTDHAVSEVRILGVQQISRRRA